MNIQQAIPDNVAEAITTIIISLITWWLGRKKGNEERRKRPR